MVRSKVLQNVIVRVGNFVLMRQRAIKKINYKDERMRNAVTEIDVRAEHMIRREIKKYFPHDSIIGEELPPEQGTSEFRWIIDPIDGTANYISSIPFYCTSIALMHKKNVVSGGVYDPTHRELFIAEQNRGARLNGKLLRVTPAKSIRSSFCGFGFGNVARGVPLYAKISNAVAKSRHLGSTALALCYVAANRLQGYVATGVPTWDISAGIIMVREAGAKALQLNRIPLDLSSNVPLDMIAGHQNYIRAILRVIKNPQR